MKKDYREQNMLRSCILAFSNQLCHPQKTSLEEETNDLFILYKNNYGQKKTKRQFLNYLLKLKELNK